MGDYADDFGEPQQKPQKSGGGFLKTCLICGCLLILLGGGAVAATMYAGYRFAKEFVATDPATVATRASEIVPCTIPSGYQGAFAMKIPGALSMVMIGPAGMLQNQQAQGQLPLMIMMFTVPPGQGQMTPEQMQQQMMQGMQRGGQGGPNTQMQVESTQTKTYKVRGADVAFTEQVGAGNNGARMKQVFTAMPRAPGSAETLMLMFMGAEQTFDQAAMEAFLASIR